MGLKGRARRIKNFGNRAKAFQRDSQKLQRSEIKFFDTKGVVVGTGQNKRLILKKRDHLSSTKYWEQKYLDMIKNGTVILEYCELVPVVSDVNTGVQEYFNKPSLYSLREFLASREGRKMPEGLSKDDFLRCRQFANQHRGINLSKILEVTEECGKFWLDRNIIVLGQNNAGKVRIALVDV